MTLSRSQARFIRNVVGYVQTIFYYNDSRRVGRGSVNERLSYWHEQGKLSVTDPCNTTILKSDQDIKKKRV